jgi:hypothetical protein
MAKKKEDVAAVVAPSEVPDTGLLNPANASPQVQAQAGEPEVVIDEVDFNELLELEKAARTTEEQLNKLAGTIFRLAKDQDAYHAHERTLNGQIDTKRKDLIRRYKVNEKRQWKIDINTRKVVYSD